MKKYFLIFILSLNSFAGLNNLNSNIIKSDEINENFNYLNQELSLRGYSQVFLIYTKKNNILASEINNNFNNINNIKNNFLNSNVLIGDVIDNNDLNNKFSSIENLILGELSTRNCVVINSISCIENFNTQTNVWDLTALTCNSSLIADYQNKVCTNNYLTSSVTRSYNGVSYAGYTLTLNQALSLGSTYRIKITGSGTTHVSDQAGFGGAYYLFNVGAGEYNFIPNRDSSINITVITGTVTIESIIQIQ